MSSSGNERSPNSDAYEAEDQHFVEQDYAANDTEMRGNGGGFEDLFGGESDAGEEQTETTNMPKIPKRTRLQASTAADQHADVSSAEQRFLNDEDEDDEDDNGGPHEDYEDKPATVNPKQAEIDELNRRIDAAIKSGRSRKRRKADEDDASIDEKIMDLRRRMRDAAYHDIDDNKDRLPAIHKVAMLADVIEELRKTHLHEAFLDNNIVDSFRLWLEPLDDGSLPSLDIQNALLDILKKLPIRRDHLRESGIGKIVLFMSKCPRIPERNRRTCEQFVQQWSRMVLRLSSNFRDRRIKEASVALDRRHFSSRQGGGTASTEPRRAPGGIQVESGSGKHGERATARIPQRVAASYNVMPVSSISLGSDQRSAGRDVQDKYKRLRQTMVKTGRKP